MVYVEIFGVTVNLYAQIVGTVGLVVIVWSYQLKKTAYLALSTLAMAIFLAESCLLYADADTFTGIVLNAAAIVRNLLMLLWRALRTRTARPDRPLSSCRRLGRMRLSSHGMVHLPSARSADGVYPVFPLQKLLRSESRRPRTGERKFILQRFRRRLYRHSSAGRPRHKRHRQYDRLCRRPSPPKVRRYFCRRASRCRLPGKPRQSRSFGG